MNLKISSSFNISYNNLKGCETKFFFYKKTGVLNLVIFVVMQMAASHFHMAVTHKKKMNAIYPFKVKMILQVRNNCFLQNSPVGKRAF